MSLTDPGRKRLARDFIAPFRILGMLLPLAFIVEICAAVHAETSRLSQKSLVSFAYFFPPISTTDYNHYRVLVLIGALLVIVFYVCPDRLKKPFLTLAAIVYIALFLNVGYASVYLAGVAFLWICFQRAEKILLNLIAIALFTAFEGTIAFTFQGFQRVLAFSLVIMTVFKAYGEIIDLHANPEVLPFCDHFLLLVGGFPCNFIGPCYSQTAFTKTFLTRPWEEIARKGVVQIYSGLLKLAVVVVYHSALFSGLLWPDPANPSGGPYLSTTQLWFLGFVGYLNFLLIQIGCYQLQQGLNRLFGYELEDQCQKPWLASSPLDFWRRLTAIDRQYMLKYVFYPTYRALGNAYVPIFLVFHILALAQFLRIELPARGLYPIQLLGGFVREAVFALIFSLACSLEIGYRSFRKSTDLTERPLGSQTPIRRFFAIAALWAFLIATCMQRWVFVLPSPWPTQVQGRSILERYIALYSCVAGYCWNPKFRG